MNALAAPWHDGPGPWILLLPLVWAAVVIGVVTLLRRTVWRGRGFGPRGFRGAGFRGDGLRGAGRQWDNTRQPEANSPLTLLGRRFAAGEIDEDEYWRRLSVLDQEFGTHRGEAR